MAAKKIRVFTKLTPPTEGSQPLKGALVENLTATLAVYSGACSLIWTQHFLKSGMLLPFRLDDLMEHTGIKRTCKPGTSESCSDKPQLRTRG